jgi:uncharacterized paraquat-inducible protein A
MTTVIICEGCDAFFEAAQAEKVDLYDDDDIENYRCPRCDAILRSVPFDP